MALRLYRPRLEDLWFRQALLSDPETMSYNKRWGGTISFPQEKWSGWYGRWVAQNGGKRFYRYLKENGGGYVGETAYHYDDARDLYLCDVIVWAGYRGRGYGTEGLRLLCAAAVENGVAALYDDIAADNPSIGLFLRNGFTVEGRTEEAIVVKKIL